MSKRGDVKFSGNRISTRPVTVSCFLKTKNRKGNLLPVAGIRVWVLGNNCH